MLEDFSVAAKFARIIASLPKQTSVLDRYCEAGQQLLDGSGASFTVNYDRFDRQTVSSTTPFSLLIEDAQEVAGQGPGFDASRSGDVVQGDFGPSSLSLWPLLHDSLATLGFVGSMLAMPIEISRHTSGVLVVHRLESVLAFDSESATFLTRYLGAALRQELSLEDLEKELTADWFSRAVVHQATGMVVAQMRIAPADALALLRAHAYATEDTLVDVASQVVDRDLSFEYPLDDPEPR